MSSAGNLLDGQKRKGNCVIPVNLPLGLSQQHKKLDETCGLLYMSKISLKGSFNRLLSSLALHNQVLKELLFTLILE